ncbi:MAG: HNH endonuclease signature motif containing protein [Acidimicrobiia bacterium]|nr:HNH endonuclease signature motif containing protein [Acidimicrobiia bacterium]
MIDDSADLDDALGDPNLDNERRTAANRRADALGDICAAALDDHPHRDTPDTPGDTASTPTGPDRRRLGRPALGILADLDDLHTHPDDTTPVAELFESHLPLTPAELDRNLCDCHLVRMLTAGSSQPLDVGHAARRPTTAIIRALAARDAGCAFPDCDTPFRWCDAHHLQPWERHGETALTNLVTLCRHHHRLVHDHGWSCHLDPATARPRFTTPGGTTLPADATPLDLGRTAHTIARDRHDPHRRRHRPPAA